MNTPKSVINRILCTAGAVMLLFCLGELSTGSVFLNSDRSKSLLILTVLAVFFVCVKSVGFATGAGLRPDRKEVTEYIFPLAFLTVVGCIVRCVTFILIDYAILDTTAIVIYSSAALNSIVLFFLVRRLWGGPSAIAVCLFYALWDASEIITVFSSSELGISAYMFTVAQSAAFVSLLFVFLTISTVKHNRSLVLCIISGIFAGVSVLFEIGFALLSLCVITYFLMTTPRIREKKVWSKKPQPIRRGTYVLIYLLTAVVSFVAIAFVLDMFKSADAFYTVKSFNLMKPGSFIGFFKSIDGTLSDCFDLFEFPRNYFANYVHLIVCVVMFFCAAIGAFAAGKKKDVRTMVLAEYVFLTVVFVIIGAGKHLIITVVPFVLLLAVYGMNAVYEFFGMFSWVYRGGAVNPAFMKKYILPDENLSPKEEDEELPEEIVRPETEQDSFTEYGVTFGEGVAKGDERDELLNSLAQKARK